MSEYLLDLAKFSANTASAEIPDDVRTRGATILADCVGCMTAGSAEPEVQALVDHCRRRPGEPFASIVGTTDRLPIEAAALVGGTAGTWHDLDEGNLHTRAHAAIQIVPAALAEAEVTAKSGRELLDAIIVGYEVAGRLWRATKARLAVHPHGTYGPLAAAVALCRLRADRPEDVREAMNIALTLGSASSRQALGDGATVRNIYSGHSGRAAFEALALRDIGFTGQKDAPASILGQIYGESFDADEAVTDLGKTWWLRKSYFKRFPSGRYTHAALDAIEELARRFGERFNGRDITRVDVATYFMAATMAHAKVDTPFGVRFSVPALIASRILYGSRQLIENGAAAFADPQMHALAERVFVMEDPAMTAVYPDEQPATVTITFSDGERAAAAVRKTLGESDRPLPDGMLRDKFIELAGPALGDANAAKAYGAFCEIDTCSKVADLMTSMRQAAQSVRNKERPA